MFLMITDTGIIVASIISLIGMLLLFSINNSNWFKRQNFKIQAANVKAENKIKLKKLERELGLQNVKSSLENPPKNDFLSTLAPLLRNLDGDQIKGLAEQFLPENTDETEPEGLTGLLLNFAQDNPEIVEGLLQGIRKGQDIVTDAKSGTPELY